VKRLQTYETPDIVVTFDPNVCRQTDVAAQVSRCPSRALQYRLKQRVQQEG
jgi:uncharacterized Fe-S cluster protein YjdI